MTDYYYFFNYINKKWLEMFHYRLIAVYWHLEMCRIGIVQLSVSATVYRCVSVS